MTKLCGILLAILAVPAIGKAQTSSTAQTTGSTAQTKTVSSKSHSSKTTKSGSKAPAAAAKPATATVEPSPKVTYAELTIGELVGEDANRWSDKMASRVAVGGFVTQTTKTEDGDTEARICENPKFDAMDRGHCIVAKCIPKMPCDLPAVGKPVTVKGLPRYDAKVGAHWWEIQPVEAIDR